MTQDPNEKKSLALDYKPDTSPKAPPKGVTAPLNPDVVRQNRAAVDRSPLILGGVALMIVAGIALVIFLSIIENDNFNEFQPMPVVEVPKCWAESDSLLNVRSGPDFAYERVWMLPAEQRREVIAQTEDTLWLSLKNGWLPRDEVMLDTIEACETVPIDTETIVFSDDLQLPAAVEALEWGAVLEENFATDANEWLETSATLYLNEGSLILLGDVPDRAFPARHAGDQHQDVYYGMAIEWVASGADAEVWFSFHAADDDPNRGYHVVMGRDGRLRLLAGDDELQTVIQVLPTTRYEIGVLRIDESITIYLDGTQLFDLEDDAYADGGYHFRVVGEQASVQLKRFDVRTPRE